MNQRMAWSAIDDNKLTKLIDEHGAAWNKINIKFKNRSSEAVRNRFRRMNTNLFPDNSCWNASEDQLLRTLVYVKRGKWSLIEKELPHRTISSIRNRWLRISRPGTDCVQRCSPQSLTNSKRFRT